MANIHSQPDPARMPIWEALQQHIQKKPTALHVPGHKMGRGMESSFASWLGPALSMDLTELSGLDDLHNPQAAIAEAQALAARAFGAEETYFLVQGSTVGNHAMILSVCGPGDTLLMPRNSHKSVYHAIELGGIHPIYVWPRWDSQAQVYADVEPDSIRQALQQNPRVRAVLITSPTYQGVVSRMAEIAAIVHEADAVLLVDEAHGAHFAFHDALPSTALEAGADGVVQSTHKMLGSLTGTAMLHVQGQRMNRQRLRHWLSVLQTSSPSYLFLASLDVARQQMVTQGKGRLEHALGALRVGMKSLEAEGIYRVESWPVQDPFKWWVNVEATGLSGYEIDRLLQEQHGIFIEMAGPSHVLAVFSFADGLRMIQRFIQALREIASLHAAELGHQVRGSTVITAMQGEPVMSVREALYRDAEAVELGQAAGCVAAEYVIPYPPGSPWLVPGERWTAHLIDQVQHLKQAGARFQGIADSDLCWVQVVREGVENG